jgi:Tol biopolymer transport system component
MDAIGEQHWLNQLGDWLYQMVEAGATHDDGRKALAGGALLRRMAPHSILRPLRTALLATVLLATPADALAGDGRIVFTSNRDNNVDIYTMDGDGSDVRRLTTHADWDMEPAWSPDGTRIAFQSRRDRTDKRIASSELYVMQADGSGQTRLTQKVNPWDFSDQPVWAPSGASLLYRSNNGVGGNLWTIGADGTGAAQFTHHGELANLGNPDFSPDGSRIAFSSNHDTNNPMEWDLYVMDADGTDVVRLTDTPGVTEGTPVWSPDGTEIAYTTDVTMQGSTIDVMRPDGTGRRRVTSGHQDGSPAWSPDGRRLAFARLDELITSDILVVDADGGTPRFVTHEKDYDWSAHPDWIAGGDELGPLKARVKRAGVVVSFTIAAPADVTLALERCAKRTCKRIAKDTFVAAAGKQNRPLKAGALKRGRYRVRAITYSDGRATSFRVR